MISRVIFIAVMIAALAAAILVATLFYIGTLHDDGTASVEPGMEVPSKSATISARPAATTPTEQTVELHVPDPVTPDDTSIWASHVNDLRSLAENGDLDASIRLFEESFDCRLYHGVLESIPAYLNDRRSLDAKQPDPEDLQEDATELRRLQEIVDDQSELCAGSNPNSVEQVFHSALLRAAKQGYPLAQSCYVGGPYTRIGESPAYKNAVTDEYMHYAPIFTRIALQDGVWSVARRSAYLLISEGYAHPSRLDGMESPDPYLTWRAVRLTYYRTKPAQRDYILYLLEQIEEKTGLTDVQLERADQWAQEKYDSKFSQLPPLEDVEKTYRCRRPA